MKLLSLALLLPFVAAYGEHCRDGQYECDGYNSRHFKQCDHGRWVKKECGYGTVCVQDGHRAVYCGWGDDHDSGYNQYSKRGLDEAETSESKLEKRSLDDSVELAKRSYGYGNWRWNSNRRYRNRYYKRSLDNVENVDLAKRSNNWWRWSGRRHRGGNRYYKRSLDNVDLAKRSDNNWRSSNRWSNNYRRSSRRDGYGRRSSGYRRYYKRSLDYNNSNSYGNNWNSYDNSYGNNDWNSYGNSYSYDRKDSYNRRDSYNSRNSNNRW